MWAKKWELKRVVKVRKRVLLTPRSRRTFQKLTRLRNQKLQYRRRKKPNRSLNRILCLSLQIQQQLMSWCFRVVQRLSLYR
uniref:Uncharacterized protein n=1 Tax=Brassica oleracea TaxID=3712 RepID=A0A3P6EN67_BRAOL|nr:unnamed protein product [Brassica oleracea]